MSISNILSVSTSDGGIYDVEVEDGEIRMTDNRGHVVDLTFDEAQELALALLISVGLAKEKAFDLETRFDKAPNLDEALGQLKLGGSVSGGFFN